NETAGQNILAVGVYRWKPVLYHEGGDARPLARQKWIGNGQDSIGALTAEREECPVEVTLLRRLDDLEIEMQHRCCSPCILDGDNAKGIRRVGQHRHPREVRE